MRETGIVEEIIGKNARVRVIKKSACGENCASCGGCVPSERTLEAKNSIGAEAGDRVILELAGERVLSAAALVYILPLAVFIAVYFLCMNKIAAESARIVLSTLAAAAVLVSVYFYQRKKGTNYMPDIVEIIKY